MEIINVTGKPCPIPVIEAKKALRSADAGSRVRLLVDNDIARQNLEKMAKGMGCEFSYEAGEGATILVTIIASALPAKAADGNLVVAIGKNTMGTGNDDLGAILIKAFIYSLTELDVPPETILFFNSGVRLTTEGSNVLGDLETLEKKGAIIISCGTCLDFYKLKEKLAIGSVTNMYAIASAMSSAGKLINL
ncbi:MAG: sulfurtransferase-like selenium metabolism protein YedF [Treponema sp.]|jgi:selenium metabolism protein YedF|nr:sulfurtransferase-like selenium metabolism protein YedF [Treponema sp.]